MNPIKSLEPDKPRTQAALPSPTLAIDGHEFRLFVEAGPLIAAMVEDIRNAKRRVWVESYIVADDAGGRAIVEALAERAKAGLDVRLMYDAVGSLGIPAALFAPLQAAGGKVHVFHSFWESLRRFSLFQIFNRRNHRKLLIVDDAIAFFGGMNIVDQSAVVNVDDVKKMHLPRSAGWRDVHLRMVGPRQAEVAAGMEWLWKRAHHERVRRRPAWRVRKVLASLQESFHFFDTQPWRPGRRIERLFAPLIRNARESLVLSIAYFLPLGRVLRELEKARKRGVKIVVILPGESDIKWVQYATRHVYEKLLRDGFEIYERQFQMLHSKVIVVDHVWTVVGSANLDARSLDFNLEYVGLFRSPRMAEAVESICKGEIEHSLKITLEHCHKRTWKQRWIDRLAWFFRGWL